MLYCTPDHVYRPLREDDFPADFGPRALRETKSMQCYFFNVLPRCYSQWSIIAACLYGGAGRCSRRWYGMYVHTYCIAYLQCRAYTRSSSDRQKSQVDDDSQQAVIPFELGARESVAENDANGRSAATSAGQSSVHSTLLRTAWFGY